MLPPRAYIFIGLNGLRALSILACLLVFASSIVTMVHDVEAVNRFVAAGKTNATDSGLLDCDYIADSTVPNQPAGAFWAVLNRLLIIFQIIVLILSELGWPQSFFNRFFPVLGSDFGLGALGVMQGLIGAAILSHHVDDFALVSAFFLFVVGCLNIFFGLIFRQHAKSKRSITSWREQAKGVLPAPVQRAASAASAAASLSSTVFGTPMEKNEGGEKWAGYGFGRQGEKKAGLKGFLISKPLESLPRYAPKPAAGDRASSPAF
ncbi:hypothetical protein BV25DRAFT_1907100 [Artomyces pyxidatus]|uniref:Uncharacterized protein n=1 Tax=Artomyces pyxidatus TaxID=48021 RepID=A0ACB8T3A4_9AGAM|nr:hypothetical protein BV25DRAFT_1907100 [Artomyces pyxidatus]